MPIPNRKKYKFQFLCIKKLQKEQMTVEAS